MDKPPSTRFSFMPGGGDEMSYLNDKISYWWRARHDHGRALAFASRLERPLGSISRDDESIAHQGHFALLSEVKGDLANAIRHKRKEIAGMRKIIKYGTPLAGGFLLPPRWPLDRLGVPRGLDIRFLAELLCQLGDLLSQVRKPMLAHKAVTEANALSLQYRFKLERGHDDREVAREVWEEAHRVSQSNRFHTS